MKISGIYGFHNTMNGKWYIGQSVDVLYRKINHRSNLRHGKHFNAHLQGAVLKYGLDAFEFHILEEVPVDMLDIREIAWIAYYKSTDPNCGYNRDAGATGGLKRLSEETKRKIGLKSASRRHSSETRKRISIGQKNRDRKNEPHTMAGAKIAAEKNRGKKRTLEARIRMSRGVRFGPESAESKAERRRKAYYEKRMKLKSTNTVAPFLNSPATVTQTINPVS